MPRAPVIRDADGLLAHLQASRDNFARAIQDDEAAARFCISPPARTPPSVKQSTPLMKHSRSAPSLEALRRQPVYSSATSGGSKPRTLFLARGSTVGFSPQMQRAPSSSQPAPQRRVQAGGRVTLSPQNQRRHIHSPLNLVTLSPTHCSAPPARPPPTLASRPSSSPSPSPAPVSPSPLAVQAVADPRAVAPPRVGWAGEASGGKAVGKSGEAPGGTASCGAQRPQSAPTHKPKRSVSAGQEDFTSGADTSDSDTSPRTPTHSKADMIRALRSVGHGGFAGAAGAALNAQAARRASPIGLRASGRCPSTMAPAECMPPAAAQPSLVGIRPRCASGLPTAPSMRTSPSCRNERRAEHAPKQPQDERRQHGAEPFDEEEDEQQQRLYSLRVDGQPTQFTHRPPAGTLWHSPRMLPPPNNTPRAPESPAPSRRDSDAPSSHRPSIFSTDEMQTRLRLRRERLSAERELTDSMADGVPDYGRVMRFKKYYSEEVRVLRPNTP